MIRVDLPLMVVRPVGEASRDRAMEAQAMALAQRGVRCIEAEVEDEIEDEIKRRRK